MANDSAAFAASGGIFSDKYRVLTIGVVLAMSTVAFEGMALTTVAPVVAVALDGEHLYGWIFSAFLLTQVVSTVVAGQQLDMCGPAAPFAVALVLFSSGLVLGSVAPTMEVLIVARAVQGLGGGAVATCVYAVVNANYPDALRARMMASISTAWVVPSLIGPAVAGFVAEWTSWRFVFAGIVPLLLVAGMLATPAFRSGAPPVRRVDGAAASRLPNALRLAAGAGLFLAGLEARPVVLGVALAAGGLALGFPAFRALLPPGTLRARPGLGATVATRGLFVSAFFTTSAFLVLALTSLGGYSAGTAGLAISAGSLAWTGGAWLQERLDRRNEGRFREWRVVLGVALMATGITGVTLPIVLAGEPDLIFASIAWVIAGLGIGLAHPTISTMAFAQAPSGGEGAVSSSLLLADLATPAVTIGIGGVLVSVGTAAGWEPWIGVSSALGVAVVCIFGALVAGQRLRRGAERTVAVTRR
jgi:MFS family permease